MKLLERLTIGPHQHYLSNESGRPFFWLGDTAWELFHRLDRAEAKRYFENRQQKRFTIVQAVILAELDGLNTPNRYGERPLIDNDPTRPNEAYFAYVDELVQMAAAHDLYVGLLPTWADKLTENWGAGPVVFTEENARVYGRYLGQRYCDFSHIVWVLGGDRPPVHGDNNYIPIWRAMAAGLDEGEGRSTLKTYHTRGGESTSRWLHDQSWLDLHMMQSGHGGGRDVPVWDWITYDYNLSPPKPTLDSEINYEDHPVNPWPSWDPASGYFRDHDVRKQAYRSVFAGACGVTYGHHFIWQMWDTMHGPVMNNGDEFMLWSDALDRPGAAQMQHLRTLMESRPFFERIPDQSILQSNPGGGSDHVRATRDAQGRYLMVYLPTTRPVSVRLDVIAGEQARGWWYDPRSGAATAIGEFPTNSAQTFSPPDDGPDWVLVVDSLDAGFDTPGTT